MQSILGFGMCKSLDYPMVLALTAENFGELKLAPCYPVITEKWSIQDPTEQGYE